jgi:hypothetical protein
MANNNTGGVIGTILALVITGSFKSCMREMYTPNTNFQYSTEPTSTFGPCGAQPCYEFPSQ